MIKKNIYNLLIWITLYIMGLYHILIWADNIGGISINILGLNLGPFLCNIKRDPYLYFIHNESYNIMILILLIYIFYLHRDLKQQVKSKLKLFHVLTSIVIAPYFIYKVIINILYMFDSFTIYIKNNNFDINYWAVIAIGIITLSFIIIRLANESKIYKIWKYIIKYIDKYFNSIIRFFNNNF